MIIGATTQVMCSKCNKAKALYVNFEDFNAGKLKCDCGGTLGSVSYSLNKSKKWNPPLVDRTLGYYDNQLGTYIHSTSDKRAFCKKHGWVEIKHGEINQVKRREKSESEKFNEYRQTIKDAAYKANFPLRGVN
ncbi:MAG: hypothetical protein KKH98_01065 [Spirochaetes bacterium]|nr:hypothetical protein [Spirochaetota bacterium]